MDNTAAYLFLLLTQFSFTAILCLRLFVKDFTFYYHLYPSSNYDEILRLQMFNFAFYYILCHYVLFFFFNKYEDQSTECFRSLGIK